MSKPKHHIRQEVCGTRAPYRDGRKPTAVKVYTIHHESKYLIVQGVPTVGASDQLVKLFASVGDVDEHKILDEYPGDQFTEVYLIKYKRIQSARFAKRKFDDWSFYGGVLHVCYAPEFETVQETREKLRERRRVVEAKTRQYKSDGTYSGIISQQSVCRLDDSRKTSQHDVLSVQSSQNLYTDTAELADKYSGEPTGSEVLREQVLSTSALHSSSAGTQQLGGYSAIYNERNQYLQYEIMERQQEVDSGDRRTHGLNLPESTGTGNWNTNIGHYTRQVPLHPASAYAEQVIQQAKSLQNYGQSSSKAIHENRSKRPSSDTFSGISNEASQSTQDMSADNVEELVLPPPPKQTRFSHEHCNNTKKYGGAKVPSAQATFPVDFDARTGHQSLADSNKLKDPECFKKDLDKINADVEPAVNQSKVNTETMQGKVEENLKNKNLVIKDYKQKGTVPRFIPRQTQAKMKSVKTLERSMPSEVTSKTDELNVEIRKNAYKLGKVQGAAAGPSISNEHLDSEEKSVIDSIVNIRKKMVKLQQ